MRRLIAPLTALALVVSATAAPAKEWIHPVGAQAAAPGSTPIEAAQQFLDDAHFDLALERVDLSPRTTLDVKSRSGTAMRTVHFEQRYHGLRVIDRGVSVRLRGLAAHALSVDVARALDVSPVPSIDVAQAAALVSAHVGAPLVPERSELALLGREAGVLVWILDVRDTRGGQRYIVDAHAGTLLMSGGLGQDALGRVYKISSVTSPTPTDEELVSLDASGHLNGWNGLLAVTNYVSGDQQSYTVEQTLAPNPVGGADYLYDPPADPLDDTDGFAQVNLFYHLTTMRDYYAELGIDVTQPSWKLTAMANTQEAEQPLDNAFFSPMGITGPFAAPNLIAIGQGSVGDFAYDSDVFKHEFGHYVTSNTVSYNLGPFHSDAFGLSPFGGGLDEGTADYFACSANDDPVLGEASLALLGSARDLTDTTKRCPDDILGEPHADGEIIGSLGWTIRTHLGQHKADRVMWGAISMLTPGPSFGDFGRALLQSAADLVESGDLTQSDADQVAADVAARGLDDCDQTLALEDGQSRSVGMIGLSLLGQLFGGSCEALKGGGFQMQSFFHFSRATKATDEAVHFKIDMQPETSGDVSFTVFVRKEFHVTFIAPGGFSLPAPTVFDAKFDFAGPTGDVVLDKDSMPAFEPGATYFIAVVHSSCPNVQMTTSADNIDTTPPVSSSSTVASTGAGGAGGEGGSSGSGEGARGELAGGGCDCTVGDEASGARQTGGVLALAALGLSLARRRRRRVS
jgi:MYXO-CTERM domain-containing protein